MDLRERPEAATQRHPWEVSRMRFFRGVLEGRPTPRRWLDAGAGDGWLARQLSGGTGAELTCWDAFYDDGDLAALRAEASGAGTEAVRFVRDAPAGPFGRITALDVLEHVEDDVAFLEQLRERLASGGELLISVPAWPALFTEHDRRLHHYRRYRPEEVRRHLLSHGFVIEEGGGLFHSLLPVRALGAARERLLGAPAAGDADLGWRAPEPVTRAVLAALALDNRFSRWVAGAPVALPGLSYWARCRLA